MSAFLAFRNAAFASLRPTVTRLHQPAFRGVQNFARTKEKMISRPPRDEEIGYNFVRFVDPVTKRLTEPRRLVNVLRSINREETYIELVSVDPGSPPIVKIIQKKEEFDKAKQSKLRAREVAMNNRHKEIQFTWGSTSSDMTHKLERVRQELEKGLKVDLIFAPKKGQVLPRPEERHLQTQEIMDMMADVGKEWKPRDHGRTVTAMFLQGSAPPALVAQKVEKIPKRVRRKEELKARERLKSQKTNSDDDAMDIYQD